MKTVDSFFAHCMIRECTFLLHRAKLPVILLSILLAGCIRPDMQETGAAGRVFTLSYSFDTPQTRATATGSERAVKDVAVFFYNADDVNPDNETYVDCLTTTVPSSSGSSGSFPLPLPPTVVPGNKYKLIIIGNYMKYAPEGKSPADYAGFYDTRTYSRMKQEIQGQLASDEARVTTPLPFWGRLLGKDGNETTLTGPTTTDTDLGVSVKFSRAVARFDVTNLAADRLKIAWVKVCNYRNRGYFYHEYLSAGEIVRGTASDTPPLPLVPSKYPGYVPAGEPSGIPGNLRQNLNAGGLYAFPNTVSYTSQDDKLTTCLMIAGYYQDPKGTVPNTTKLTYYRANVSENGSSQILRRNYVYVLVINDVKKEGAETEEGAVNEKEKLLDYVVGDDWESEGGGTVTDGAGNFLTLSRTSVVLGSEAGEAAVIKVAVKKGTAWEVVWDKNDENAFRYEKVNDESFSIITKGKNETLFTHNASLTVRVTEKVATTLSLTVNVIQLSSVNDPQMLTVEGRVGSFDQVVPGQGGIMSLQVITGSPTSKWKAEPQNDLSAFLSNYTQTGANGGTVDLNFMANTGGFREGTLIIKRLLPDGSTVDPEVDPVVVTFKQDKSPYVVSLLPNYGTGVMEIEGFSAAAGNPNGIVSSHRFQVQLADPVNYTFTATCSLHKTSDAFLTIDRESPPKQAGPVRTQQVTSANASTVAGKAGQNIWLNVFRTGPGDAPISGDITVTAVPNPGTDLPTSTYTVKVRIKTSCKIGDSKIGPLLWADRNVDATSRGEGGSLVGLNYTNDKTSDDYTRNSGFKGGYYAFKDASGRCKTFGKDNRYEGTLATGWRLPTNPEQATVADRMRFSKQRVFIVSDDRSNGTVGCWFPLSGTSSAPNGTLTYYWSGMASTEAGKPYSLCINTDFAKTSYDSQTLGFPVRCVR